MIIHGLELLILVLCENYNLHILFKNIILSETSFHALYEWRMTQKYLQLDPPNYQITRPSALLYHLQWYDSWRQPNPALVWLYLAAFLILASIVQIFQLHYCFQHNYTDNHNVMIGCITRGKWKVSHQECSHAFFHWAPVFTSLR